MRPRIMMLTIVAILMAAAAGSCDTQSGFSCHGNDIESVPGADSAACTQARTFMRGICPDEWVERWDEEREEGKFAGLQ